MPGLERAAGQAQVRAHDGGRGALVSVDERVVRDDPERVASRFLSDGSVELLPAEGLEGLGEGGVQHPLVAHAVGAAEPGDGGGVDGKDVLF